MIKFVLHYIDKRSIIDKVTIHFHDMTFFVGFNTLFYLQKMELYLILPFVGGSAKKGTLDF